MEKEIIGKCPKCNANVYEGYSYYCSNYKTGCKFNLKKENDYYGQTLIVNTTCAKKLINGETIQFWIKNNEGKKYLADFFMEIDENNISLKKFENKKNSILDSNTKYYIHKKYGIKLDGITADIHIDKGTKGFITKKLENIKISSFKASSPYINIKSIINAFNLNEDVEKIFIISSDEVKDQIDVAIRNKNNREFLEGMTYYTDITYGNGVKKREQHFENNLNIYPFKYSSYANDSDTSKPIYFNLHSKIYLINNEYAFIGSANLTEKGLSSNFETLFFIDKKISPQNAKLIDELINFFEKVANEKNIVKEEEIFNFIETSNTSDLKNITSTTEVKNNNDNINPDTSFFTKLKSFFKF